MQGLGAPYIRLDFTTNEELLEFAKKYKNDIEQKKSSGGDDVSFLLNGIGAVEVINQNGKSLNFKVRV